MSIYNPLLGSSYIELPDKLRKSVIGLINIKDNDNKCFLWCHIWHLNLLKRQERITKADETLTNDLDYKGIKFPVTKSDYCKCEQKIYICIYVFCYEIIWIS